MPFAGPCVNGRGGCSAGQCTSPLPCSAGRQRTSDRCRSGQHRLSDAAGSTAPPGAWRPPPPVDAPALTPAGLSMPLTFGDRRLSGGGALWEGSAERRHVMPSSGGATLATRHTRRPRPMSPIAPVAGRRVSAGGDPRAAGKVGILAVFWSF